jgi:hypothetical protein
MWGKPMRSPLMKNDDLCALAPVILRLSFCLLKVHFRVYISVRCGVLARWIMTIDTSYFN